MRSRADPISDHLLRAGRGSPRLDPTTGELLWVDITAGHRASRRGSTVRRPDRGADYEIGGRSGSVGAAARAGRRVGDRRQDGFAHLAEDGTVTPLATGLTSGADQMNDGACRSGRPVLGRLAGDPAGEPARRLFRLDADGSVAIVLTGLTVANGIGFTAGRRDAVLRRHAALTGCSSLRRRRRASCRAGASSSMSTGGNPDGLGRRRRRLRRGWRSGTRSCRAPLRARRAAAGHRRPARSPAHRGLLRGSTLVITTAWLGLDYPPPGAAGCSRSTPESRPSGLHLGGDRLARHHAGRERCEDHRDRAGEDTVKTTEIDGWSCQTVKITDIEPLPVHREARLPRGRAHRRGAARAGRGRHALASGDASDGALRDLRRAGRRRRRHPDRAPLAALLPRRLLPGRPRRRARCWPRSTSPCGTCAARPSGCRCYELLGGAPATTSLPTSTCCGGVAGRDGRWTTRPSWSSEAGTTCGFGVGSGGRRVRASPGASGTTVALMRASARADSATRSSCCSTCTPGSTRRGRAAVPRARAAAARTSSRTRCARSTSRLPDAPRRASAYRSRPASSSRRSGSSGQLIEDELIDHARIDLATPASPRAARSPRCARPTTSGSPPTIRSARSARPRRRTSTSACPTSACRSRPGRTGGTMDHGAGGPIVAGARWSRRRRPGSGSRSTSPPPAARPAALRTRLRVTAATDGSFTNW